MRPKDWLELPIDAWVEFAIKDWLVPNFRWVFQAIQKPVAWLLNGIEAGLLATPVLAIIIVFTAIGWYAAGRRIAIFTLLSLLVIDMMGVWAETMTTLSMILTAVAFCIVVGVPLGILTARSDRFAAGIRPILDIMQTIPPFVYLVPIVMLFGVGLVPGVIATIIFALAPVIRLTSLGIRQVQEELVEAAYAFGATPRMILLVVQVPLALRTIMTGVNQTLMLALSMAVIAALIGAAGLGLTVVTGLGRLDVGRAAEGGLGIVLLAIMLDRITQALSEHRHARQRSLWQTIRMLFTARHGRALGSKDGDS
jgi:glycine betaine/proline transport system permease protein